MNSTKYMPFPLGIHLLRGLVNPPDLPIRPQSQHPRPTKPIRRYDGPIFLPPQIYKLLSEDAIKALKSYSYNTETITRFHQRKVHNTEIVETPQDDPPGPPVPENDPPDVPESDLDIPDDPILDFVNSQCHNSEDLDQALQAYQAYQVQSPQDSTITPERSIDHHFTYAFDPNFDEFGDYTQRAIQTLSILDNSSSTLTPSPTFMANQHEFTTYQHAVKHEAPDYEKFRPYFGWVNVDTVQKTMEQSTQWGVSLPNTFPMKKHLKSRNPALNIPRRHEAVATDTVFSDTPAVDSGLKQAQVFVGRGTLVADAYPMKSGKQFVNTLEDNIRRRGAMDKLLSDSAKTEISNKVMDILRAYHISNWHSEPYHQNQNPAEWRYRTIKSWTNTIMNRSGAPANCWLLCLIYLCYLLNHIACTALDGKIPLLALAGITPDISIIYFSLSISLCSMQHMTNISPLKVKKGLATG